LISFIADWGLAICQCRLRVRERRNTNTTPAPKDSGLLRLLIRTYPQAEPIALLLAGRSSV